MARAKKEPPLFLSAKQLAALHVGKAQLGLDDETYRLILTTYGGVASARDLDNLGFDRVMRELRRLGFTSTFAKRTFGGDRPGMASASQISLIRNLWAEWSDAAPEDESAINAWLERHYGVSALRFLTPAAAGKAITGLRAMGRRKRAT